jgi:hypothetical protein
MRALSPDGDPDWAWRVPTLNWRDYWVDVEYPGLQTWSIPIIRGEKIAADPASVPPLYLTPVRHADRAASK